MKKLLILLVVATVSALVYACDTATTVSTSATTSDTTLSTLDPDSLEANIPAECEGVAILSGWVPTWCEEFNYEGGVDPAKWRHQTGGGGFGNNELQYYTNRSQNAYVDGEKLILTAIREDYGGEDYTSAKIWTQGIKNWKYGKFEMRAKLPGVPGTWPAFWMMPKQSVYGSWPASGEIDIMEHTAFYNIDNVVGSLHTAAYNHKIGTQISYSRETANLTTDFHVYSVTWNEYSFSWWVDNYKYGSYVFNAASVAGGGLKISDAWPFDQEFYLILNLAMGGSMGGTVDPAFTSDTFEIDYVRVYQRDYLIDDAAPPLPATALAIANAVDTTAYVYWTKATDDNQVRYYNVYVNGVYLRSVSLNVVKLTGLTAGTPVLVEIEAEDYAGNLSTKTAITVQTTASQ